MFLIDYHCDDCGIGWQDAWECACDDECPKCGDPVTALDFEEIET